MQLMDEIRSENGVNILSLFDGMACGLISMIESGVKVNKYTAYEIDESAIKTSNHNFPFIEHRGNVFGADFTEYRGGLDYLIGGSPCTHWSICQKKNRETEASGIGWELFQQYVRALNDSRPKFFIYENNKSMSSAVRGSITETFGFEPICINSALLSAQNRNRLYWVGKLNEDGAYSRVNVQQPEDIGIGLDSVIDGCVYHLNPTPSGKIRTVDAHICRLENNLIPRINNPNPAKQQYDCFVEPVNTTGDFKSFALKSTYYKSAFANFVNGGGHYPATGVAEPVLYGNDGSTFATPSRYENGVPIKAISSADGKEHDVYYVKNGVIQVKDKDYPINLNDGYYIIRKLTVNECKKLQTVPEWYEFPVSNTQAYKMLGNGWTCSVISHLINATLENK